MFFITGGAGYIGSHCALRLLKEGKSVTVFDNLSTGHAETVKTLTEISGDNFKFIHGDLQNYNDINAALKTKPEAILHFAAFSQVGESVHNPEKYYKNNVIGSINLLNAMKENSIDKIVFSSTAAIYGEPVKLPIDENHPKNPINTYGKTKLMIENIMDDYDSAYNIKSVRLRYFNVAGADSNSQIGEWHNPETHLIPNILKSTFGSNFKLKIFGTDYDTKDGTCVRDYINIEDLISAHLIALKYLLHGGKTDYFNLGTGGGYSVNEILNTCREITNINIPAEYTERRAGDPACLIADNNKAKTILGWEPKKTLNDSISSAYNWEKNLQDRLSGKS